MPSSEVQPRRKLLVLAYFFPPSAEVAAKPTARLLRHLVDLGWDITVVTPPSSSYRLVDLAGYKDVIEGVKVVQVRSWPHPFDAIPRIKSLLRKLRRTPPHDPAVASGKSSKPPKPKGWIRRRLRELLSFPDYYSGSIVPTFQAAKRIVDREKSDAVLSVSPVVSTHLAARLLRRSRPEIVWFAQFHDPWVDNPFHQWESKLLTTIERKLEASVAKSTDRICCATKEACESFSRKYPATPCSVIYNGFDPIDFGTVQPPATRNARLEFCYVGSLYGHRDPTPFLNVLAQLIARGEVLASEVKVLFVGDCEIVGERSLRTVCDELNLNGVVEIRGSVPYPEALALQANADILLLFAEGQPAQVPAKVFEYLYLRRPILAFCSGATKTILEQAGVTHCITSQDTEATAQAIKDSVGHFRKGCVGSSMPTERIEQFNARTIAESVSKLLEAAIREKRCSLPRN